MDFSPPVAEPPSTHYLGLAPFLRASIAGEDLRAMAKAALEQVGQNPAAANLWLNLSTLMFSLGQREAGFATQNQALALERLFEIKATTQPATLRLLVLMVEGDVAANTPLDCLLEGSNIDLLLYFIAPAAPLPSPVPAHDAVFIALGDAPEHRPLLSELASKLAHWPKPVLNQANAIPNTERAQASRLLKGINGVLVPSTQAFSYAALSRGIAHAANLARAAEPLTFPLIIRPHDSHAGRDLDKIESADALQAYLARVAAEQFFIAPFIDYRSQDGLYRKFRIALVQGEAFIVHLAISTHWMIHYVNAGMYEDPQKRAEEAQFMAQFAAFKQRHQAALAAISTRMGLDYVCFDGAETRDGKLLIFEIDHVMVVHAMDSTMLFPYKAEPIKQIQTAFRQMLINRVATHTARLSAAQSPQPVR
ncbi:MAG: ATP-grasp domain-containing protein [Halothiobacillus sp.]